MKNIPKKKKNYNINTSIEPKNIASLAEKTGNLYRSINIVAKRSKQISVSLKEELHAKLQEFAAASDNLEEVHENKEQIEISRSYEKIPHSTLLALDEFMSDKIYFRDIETE